jgi:GUN4-like
MLLSDRLLGVPTKDVEGNRQSSQREQFDAAPVGSENDIYAKLQKFLGSKRWKEADQETLRIMLKVANRESYGWLDADSLCDFPSKELKIIDQLWVMASNGRFGFSVQKRVWEECGGAMAYNSNWEKFLHRIGWYKAKKPLQYENLKFSVTHSPVGELPGMHDCANGVGMPATWSKPDRSFDFTFTERDFILIELWCLFARDDL